jgi:hypothetical protein
MDRLREIGQPECDACAAAEHDPDHATYHGACRMCTARMLAHGSDRWRETPDPDDLPETFRDILRDFFGVGWRMWGEKVHDWAKRIQAAKQRETA